MFEERVSQFKSEVHGDCRVELKSSPEGNPSVVFAFSSPIGIIDFSLNYKKTKQGIASAIKRFEGVSLEQVEYVVGSIKKEMGYTDEWRETHGLANSHSNA